MVTPSLPLRICQISSVMPPSRDGVGDAVFKLHTLLSRHNIPAYVITSSDQQQTENVFCCVDRWTMRSWRVIYRKLKDNKISSVIFHYPSPRYYRIVSLSFLPFFLRLLGFHVTLYLHEYSEYSLAGKLRMLPMIIFSRTIATSDSLNVHALRRLYLTRGKINLIPTGSNFSENMPSRWTGGSFSAQPQKRLALVFGLIRSGKGIESVLRAFEGNTILQGLCELHLAGSLPEVTTPYDLQLLEQIKALSFVRYHGYLSSSQLREIFSAAHFLILPFENGLSERRGSFMAAMASGMPVVTVIPTIPIEGLVDNYNVVYLNDNTIAEIEKKLLLLSTTEDKMLKQIGANARRWYVSHYSDDILFQKLSAIVNN